MTQDINSKWVLQLGVGLEDWCMQCQCGFTGGLYPIGTSECCAGENQNFWWWSDFDLK